MTLKDMDAIDRAVLLVSTGLMLVGIVVLGIVEIIAGQPYNPAPLTNDAGEIIAQPMIDPTIRTGLVIAGLAILLLWAIYKIATPISELPREERTGHEVL